MLLLVHHVVIVAVPEQIHHVWVRACHRAVPCVCMPYVCVRVCVRRVCGRQLQLANSLKAAAAAVAAAGAPAPWT